MTGQGEPDKAHLDSLMYRMLAGLLLLGAGVLLLLTMLLLILPRIETASSTLVLLPGTRKHGVSTTALPVLGAATLALGVPGLLALALGRGGVRFGRADRPQPGTRSLLRPGLILLAGVALLVLVVLRR